MLIKTLYKFGITLWNYAYMVQFWWYGDQFWSSYSNYETEPLEGVINKHITNAALVWPPIYSWSGTKTAYEVAWSFSPSCSINRCIKQVGNRYRHTQTTIVQIKVFSDWLTERNRKLAPRYCMSCTRSPFHRYPPISRLHCYRSSQVSLTDLQRNNKKKKKLSNGARECFICEKINFLCERSVGA